MNESKPRPQQKPMTTYQQQLNRIKRDLQDLSTNKANEILQGLLAEILGGSKSPVRGNGTSTRGSVSGTKHHNSPADAEKFRNKILKQIKSKPGITAIDLINRLGVGKAQRSIYQYNIRVLKRNGVVKMKGNRRGATYFAESGK